MGLVTAKEVAKAINADKYGILGTFSGWLLMKALKISTINKVYDRNKHLKEVDFLKYNYRSPFERNIIQHSGLLENINDYIFNELGLIFCFLRFYLLFLFN